MADVFISYARKDKAFVTRLFDALEAEGREVWVDWESISPTADSFVFVISPDFIASEVCGLEIAHAVKQNKRLVPVVCRNVDAETVPQILAMLQWIFFRENDGFGGAFRALCGRHP